MICSINRLRLVGLACFAISASAQAQEPPADRELVASVRVKYADLDLTGVADIPIMLDRLEQAAFRACGGNPRWHRSYEVMPRYTVAAFKECREDAIATAVRAINAPALSRALAEAVAKAHGPPKPNS